MRHQGGGAGQQRDALERADRIAGIEQHGGYRGGHVHREGLAVDRRHLFGHRLQRRDVIACIAACLGQGDQLGRSGVTLLVHRMAEAGQGFAAGAQGLQMFEGHLGQRPLLFAALRDDAREQQAGGFRGAQDHRSATQQARGHRALQCVGRSGVRHARGLNGGHQAMLGDGHHAGVGGLDQLGRGR